MNKLFRKIAEQILLVPVVRTPMERVCQFYALVRYEKGLDTFQGACEFDGILVREQCLETDAKALKKLLNMVARGNMMVAEVGSWKGHSTSVLAKTVANYGGSVFVVDHWMGSKGASDAEAVKAQDVYSIFKRNMIALGVWDIVHPLVMDSQTASQVFADGILDLIFIDADHHYEFVKNDILSWLPKLRDGGILCGHDCEGYYSDYPDEIKKMIEQHLADDYIPNVGHHGVIKAVHDCFHKEYLIMPDSIVWYYLKKSAT